MSCKVITSATSGIIPIGVISIVISIINYTTLMPSKNSVKRFDAPAYYHVYNRGAGKQPIFHDDIDKQKFLDLLDRHLNPDNEEVRSDMVAYPKYDLEIVAYCLMKNHFHLLLYQPEDVMAMTGLMRSLLTAYTMHFNRRHRQSGHLFQGVYKASQITTEPYLAHISRYIHLNPHLYREYKWSSVSHYLGDTDHPAWLHPTRSTGMTSSQYSEFLEDYEGRKELLERIKDELGL